MQGNQTFSCSIHAFFRHCLGLFAEGLPASSQEETTEGKADCDNDVNDDKDEDEDAGWIGPSNFSAVTAKLNSQTTSDRAAVKVRVPLLSPAFKQMNGNTRGSF